MDPFWAAHGAAFQQAGMSEADVSRMPADERSTVLAMLYESAGRAAPPRAPPEPAERPALRVANFRRLATFEETRRAEGAADYAALQALWRAVVQELAVYAAFERVRYAQQIQSAVRDLGPEAPYGTVVAVLLPCGARITRTFAQGAPASAVYIWCAADEKMIRDMARPGTFVIVKADGVALRPALAIGEQLAEPRALLNARFID
jgi:hypothetical protein